MMKFIKENKELILKYLYIIVSNILIVILCNFYFRNSDYKDIFILFIALIIDMIIYYYKGKRKFKFLLDIISNIIVGVLLLLFYRDSISYGIVLFSLFFSNNITFIRSRLKDNFWLNTLQYILVFFGIIFTVFVNMCIFSLIYNI